MEISPADQDQDKIYTANLKTHINLIRFNNHDYQCK